MKNNTQVIVSKTAYGENQSSIKYWQNNRNKLSDLYPSERYFLESDLENVESVLDVGCAAGGSYSFCLEANYSLNYTGIDVSESLISMASEIHTDATFIHYEGYSLPFPENHFDIVFSLGVLHHLRHWKSIIEQMVKLSKKYTIFDLRLTDNETLDEPNEYYQKIAFGEKWDGKTAISYIVVNINELIKFFQEKFLKGGYRIESYGYFAKPTNLSNIPYDEVFMCCIRIEKKSKSPGVFVDISK